MKMHQCRSKNYPLYLCLIKNMSKVLEPHHLHLSSYSSMSFCASENVELNKY